MTREDIVKTAFTVWGRDLYRTMSLTDIASKLGVSKPALYRHFKDKDALLDAMYEIFFDDLAAFIKGAYMRALSTENLRESFLIMMRIFGEYYIQNGDAFVFSLVRVYNRQENDNLKDEFLARGIDLQRLIHPDKCGSIDYPSEFQLITTTLIFYIANFHRYNHKLGVVPSEELVKKTIEQIEEHILHGLMLDPEKIDALNYQALDKKASETLCHDTENDSLLKAVAGAVAEAGPWNASMEMVAKRSGLSKSGLYAHFKSKKEMLGKLFITEFIRIVDFARKQVETSQTPEENLYLAIITIINYLRSQPEILVAMDWIKLRRLDLGNEGPGQLYRIIRKIKLESIEKQDRHSLVRVAEWVLFMILNTLAWWPLSRQIDTRSTRPENNKDWTKSVAEIPIESFRVLVRFIALGLEGLDD